MHIAVVEPTPEGHYLASYARRVIEEVLRRGWRATLVTSEHARQHAAYDIVRDAAGGSIDTRIMPYTPHPGSHATSADLLRFQWRRFDALREGVCALGEQPDAVYLVNIDHIDKVILLRGSPFDVPWAGMLLTVRHHHARMGVFGAGGRSDRLYELFFRRLLGTRRLGAINVVDTLLDEDLKNSAPSLRARVVPAPDMAHLEPLPPRAAARQRLGVPADAQLVLLYGAVSRRKGTAELLRAAAGADDIFVYLAGRQEADVADVLASVDARALRENGRLLEHDRFLSAAEEAAAFAAADVVWLGYRGFSGMSGVLLQAAHAGVPVLACREGLIGCMAGRSGIGTVVDLEDVDQVRSALAAMRNAEVREQMAARGHELARRHTPAAFRRAVGEALDRALRLRQEAR